MARKYKYLCVDSMIPTVGKKIAKYAFRDYLLIFRPDFKEKCFYVYVSDELDEEHVINFIEYWGERWKLYRIPVKDITKYEVQKS